MPGGGTSTFLEPDLYEANLRSAGIESLITPLGEFYARLTWAELHHLRLLDCEEAFPSVTYLQLPAHLVFIAFPHSASMPVWDGMQMQAGDVMLHGRGQRLHQSTLGPSRWSVIAADPEWLGHSCRALTGKGLVVPAEGRVLQPARQNVARLRRLLAQASRLAETKARMLAKVEVARAIEQGIVPTLINCLGAANVQRDTISEHQFSQFMGKLEEVLRVYPGKSLRTLDLVSLVGVTDRTLRSCCDKFLGISPTRYLRLRQLKRVRIALRDADPAAADVVQLAARHGFNDFKRFSSLYRITFGELPSAILQLPGPTYFDAR